MKKNSEKREKTNDEKLLKTRQKNRVQLQKMRKNGPEKSRNIFEKGQKKLRKFSGNR